MVVQISVKKSISIFGLTLLNSIFHGILVIKPNLAESNISFQQWEAEGFSVFVLKTF